MIYNDIIRDFDGHLQKSGRQYYNEFYVGVTTDVEQRLFTSHRVRRDGDWWVYALADTEEIAREVEKHYLEFGMRGKTGGGTGKDGDSWYVYCYGVTLHSVE